MGVRAGVWALECLGVRLPRCGHTVAPTHFQKQVGRGTWLSCILPEKLMFVCPLKRQACTQSHGKTVPSCDDADKLMFVSRSPMKLPWSSVKQIHFLIDAG